MIRNESGAYDTESWGTERFNSATLFVLRGVTGASVEDLFGTNPRS